MVHGRDPVWVYRGWASCAWAMDMDNQPEPPRRGAATARARTAGRILLRVAMKPPRTGLHPDAVAVRRRIGCQTEAKPVATAGPEPREPQRKRPEKLR